MIDTEHWSGDIYADMLEYDVYSLYPRLNVKNTSMPLKKQRKKITYRKILQKGLIIFYKK